METDVRIDMSDSPDQNANEDTRERPDIRTQVAFKGDFAEDSERD